MAKRHIAATAAGDALLIPRALREEVLLGYHLSLACLRRTDAARTHLAKIAEVLMTSNYLMDAGYGRGSLQILAEAQTAILAVQSVGSRSGQWGAGDETLWQPLGKLLTLFDRQISRAPSSQILRAVRRYEAATGSIVESMRDDRLRGLAA